MRPEAIRTIAICVCQRDGRLLVAEGHDSRKGQTFYRPLGGTVEFGERGAETVVREFEEELGARLVDVRYLGTLENLFVYEGQRGHEIVLVYDGRLADERLYRKEVLEGQESGRPFRAFWKAARDFGAGQPPVYPDGLLALLGE